MKMVDNVELLIQTHRKKIAIFFEEIAAIDAIENSENVSILRWFSNLFASKKTPGFVYDSFQMLKAHDTFYLENVNILSRYGKDLSQTVSEPKTLFSPLIDADSEDDYDVKYAFCKNRQGGLDFIYSSELVTKLYTFEDQLFVYNAIWDYSLGCIRAEKTETFFFKDISDMSTLTEYKAVSMKGAWKDDSGRRNLFICSATITLLLLCVGLIFRHQCFCLGCSDGASIAFIIPFSLCVLTSIGLMIAWLKGGRFQKTGEMFVRASETFKISASSGNSISTTIVCNEWLEANKATYVKRSDGEKVIQAIRKMIEEKKR